MMTWTDALVAAGISVLSVDDDTVELQLDRSRRRFQVVLRSRSPRPSEVAGPPAPNALLVAPHLSAGCQKRLRELGWSWTTRTGQVHLRFPHRDFDAVPRPRPVPARAATGPLARRGLGAYSLLRRFLSSLQEVSLKQIDLASNLSLSQARVSQLLAVLTTAGLLANRDGAWTVLDWPEALDVWLAGYPGPGGTVTHWTGLDAPWTQTSRVLDALPDGAVVSGGVGADVLTPWALPRRSVIYTRAHPNLMVTGLVPVTSAAEATVSVCVPRDLSVWPLQPLVRSVGDRNIVVADPLQVLWDLQQDPSSDGGQAAEQLRT
jgi:hypothetical protein